MRKWRRLVVHNLMRKDGLVRVNKPTYSRPRTVDKGTKAERTVEPRSYFSREWRTYH